VTSFLAGLHGLARVTESIVHYPEAISGITIHPHTNPPVLFAGPGVELETNKPLPGRQKLALRRKVLGEKAASAELPRRY
jgi:hypothetical protein